MQAEEEIRRPAQVDEDMMAWMEEQAPGLGLELEYSGG